MGKQVSSGGGIGIGGLLAIVFIVLKLCKVISWSWWWVLSPVWIPLSIAAFLGVVYIGITIYGKRKGLK